MNKETLAVKQKQRVALRDRCRQAELKVVLHRTKLIETEIEVNKLKTELKQLRIKVVQAKLALKLAK